MRRPWQSLAINRRVLLNLKSGKAVGGVLWAERGGLIVLRDAALYDPDHPEGASLDGEVVIERADIDFAQIITPATPGPPSG